MTEPLNRAMSIRLWCQECAKDLQEFAELSGYRKFMEEEYPFDDEAAAINRGEEMQKFEEAKTEFMRRKVAGRGSNE